MTAYTLPPLAVACANLEQAEATLLDAEHQLLDRSLALASAKAALQSAQDAALLYDRYRGKNEAVRAAEQRLDPDHADLRQQVSAADTALAQARTAHARALTCWRTARTLVEAVRHAE